MKKRCLGYDDGVRRINCPEWAKVHGTDTSYCDDCWRLREQRKRRRAAERRGG